MSRKTFRRLKRAISADLPAGLVCPFAVSVRTLVNREHELVFRDESGNPVRAIITGYLLVRITNSESGASVIRNISGPVFLSFHADGSLTVKLTGIGNIGLFPTDEGGPALLITHGLTTFDVSSDGTITGVSTRGRVEDLCRTLS